MADRPGKPRRRTLRLRVLRSEWLTPHLVRVVLGGPGVESFADNGYTDRYVKLAFPLPGVAYPEPFDLDAVRREFPRHQWPTTRTYTIRHHDPEAGELAIDFVTHGDDGVAAPWAAAARPGDELIIRGPGGAYAPDPGADWHLLVGDESAIPAIGSALAALRPGVPAQVFLQVADEAETQKLDSPGDVEITWLYRTDDPSAGTALVDAVRAHPFPAGRGQFFVHGEAGFVADLRRHLNADRAVPKEALSISGYWRRGKNEDGWQAEKAETRRREEAGTVSPA